MTHLSHDTLVAWRDHPSEADRDRIVAHLAVCEPCSALMAELVRCRPADETAPIWNARDFADAGYGMGPRSGLSSDRARLRVTWRVVAPLAAAAALILALVVPRLAPSGDDSAPVTRGSAPEITVVQSPGAAPAFTWVAQRGAARYLVEIYDTRQQLIADLRIDGTRYELPPDLAARLSPGAEYRVLVTGLDRAGEALGSPAATSFTAPRP